MGRPLLSALSLVEVGREEVYGEPPETYLKFPLLGDVPVIAQEYEFFDRAFANARGGTDRSRAVKTQVNLPELLAHLDGATGAWMYALEAGGWKRRDDLSSGTRDVWRICQQANGSVSARVNVGGMLRTVHGCRGNAEIRAAAPFAPIEMSATLTGLPADEADFEAVGEDTTLIGEPLRFCGANFVFDPEDGPEIVPVVKSFRVASGRTMFAKRGAKVGRSVTAIRSSGRVPTWECVIEQDESRDWHEIAKLGTRFALSMEMESGGYSLGLSTPAGRTAYVAQAPRDVDADSLLGVQLVFGLSGRFDDELELVRSG